MTRLLLIFLGSAALLAAEPATPRLELDDAIDIALAQPTPEDAEVAVARARLLWLETAKGRRIEIGADTAVWSFVNPLALVTNIGASLLGPRDSSPLGILDAKIDLASASIAARSRRFDREVEVTERFNALALRQKMAERACQGVEEAREQRERLEREVRVALSTKVDVLWHEQAILDRELDCRIKEQDRAIAAAALSAIAYRSADDVRTAAGSVDPEDGARLQGPERLYDLAFEYRADLRETDPLQKEILGLWNELEDARRSGDRIVLKGNGAFEAQKRFLGQKIRRLERQAEDFKLQVRSRITEVRIRFDSLRDQLDLAKRRRALAAEQSLATRTRLHAGLASPTDLRVVRDAERLAEAEIARLEHEGGAGVTSLVVALGLQNEPKELQKLVYSTAVYTAGAR